MFRSLIYDAVFRPLTSRWYAEVLARLPENAHMLDVGVGTAGALSDNASTVNDKRLHITGIDIDNEYLQRARRRVDRAGLANNVTLSLESVYDHRGGPYDAVYFSASFMLLPEPEAALRHVSTLLKPDGRIFFTQTFSERRSRLLEIAKPLLVRITTIDFGRVTYEEDFIRSLRDGGLQLEELTVLDMNAGQSFRLAIATPSAFASFHSI